MATNRKQNSLIALGISYAKFAISMITGIFLIPIYVGFVGSADFGVWLASGNIVAWMVLMDPGIAELSRQRIAQQFGANQWDEVCSTISCSLLLLFSVAASIVIVGSLLSSQVGGWLRIDDAELNAAAGAVVRIACFGTAMHLIGNYLGGIVQGLQSNWAVGGVVLLSMLIDPVLRVCLLLYGYGIESFAYGLVASGAILLVGNALVLSWKIGGMGKGFNASLSELRVLFSLLSFTSMSNIGGIFSNNIMSFLVTRYIGPEATSIFEVTRRPIQMCRIFLDKSASALLPSFSHLKGERDESKISSYVLKFMEISMVSCLFFIGLLVVTLEDFIGIWMGPAFFAGERVAWLLIAGLAVAVMHNGSRMFYYSIGSIKYVGVASILIQALSVTMAFSVVQIFGIHGLAATPLIAFLLLGFWLLPLRFFREYLLKSGRAWSFAGTLLLCASFSLLCANFAHVSLSWFVLNSSIANLLWKAAAYIVPYFLLVITFTEIGRSFRDRIFLIVKS